MSSEAPKPPALSSAGTELTTVPTIWKPKFPGRPSVLVLIIDRTGSMLFWDSANNRFVRLVIDGVTKLDPAALDYVYVLVVTISGDVASTEFVPLRELTLPECTPGGQSPQGQACQMAAEKLAKFWKDIVLPEELSVRNLGVVYFGDLKANKETPEETERGLLALKGFVEGHRGTITVIGPDAKEMDAENVRRLGLDMEVVKYLDAADPDSIIKWTIVSMTGGGKP